MSAVKRLKLNSFSVYLLPVFGNGGTEDPTFSSFLRASAKWLKCKCFAVMLLRRVTESSLNASNPIIADQEITKLI